MSLAIAFKGTEGIVLAADSRVTLNAAIQLPLQAQPMLLPATFDNATKLFRFEKQKFVGAVTYGSAAIGIQEPRTAHSFLPELEASLPTGRISVEAFATKLGAFFLEKWTQAGMPNPVHPGQDMFFLIGGYDEKAPYGRVLLVAIPSNPKPVDSMSAPGHFGIQWGGQSDIAERLINGSDQRMVPTVRELFKQPLANVPPQNDPVTTELKKRLSARIPWQFLPLQDCVDLSIFLIKTTITLQKWLVDVRGVGGHIDVATITPITGFNEIQQKQVIGETQKR
jgi:hypothetical protein